MAILHVGPGGSNTAPYETWAKAGSSLVTVAATAIAGDTVYFDSSYTDSAAGQTISFTGGSSAAAPIKILCGTHSGASGLDALATGGVFKSTNTTFQVGAADLYVYGMTFEASSATSTDMIFCRSSVRNQMYEDCTFYVSSATPTGSRVNFGFDTTAATTARIILKNPVFRFGNNAQGVGLNSHVEIYGGSQHASSADPTAMFIPGNLNRGSRVFIDGFDFTNCLSSVKIFDGENGSGAIYCHARNCKMPTSWSGTVAASPSQGGNYYELVNYGINGVTGSNYKFNMITAQGNSNDSSSIYRTGGASDEVTPYSIKMTTTANCGYPNVVYYSVPMYVRVAASVGGSPSTITVHCTHDRATAFTDKEVWLEVNYQGTASYPLGTFANDKCAILTGAVGAGTAQTTSSESWTGTGGFSNAKTIQLEVTGLTFQQAGYAVCRVIMAVPSVTLYVCPKVTVS